MNVSQFEERKTQRHSIYYVDRDENIVAKKCTSYCGEVKPLEAFGNMKKGLGGKHPRCKECKAKETRKFNKENPDKKAEHDRNYYLNNKEKVNEYNRNWAKENRGEERREYERERRNNPEIHKRRLAWRRKWAMENKEIEYERTRKWRKENKDAITIHGLKRRSLIKNLPFELDKEGLKNLLEIQDGVCVLSDSTKTNLEHFIPVSSGHGGTTFENCYYMDETLNLSKGAKNPFEWVETQSEDIQERFYMVLVPMMAERNNMNIEEFEAYVNECFENKRDAV
jgi:hypothetical protein